MARYLVVRPWQRLGSLVALSLVVVAAFPVRAPFAEDVEGQSAVKILLGMKKTYRGCRSYRDTGEVRVSGSVEGGSFASRLPFATGFVRDGAFRFEFTDQGLGERESRFILWSSGGQVRAWWEAQGGERRVASLSEALGAASGVSAGASLRVPGLLLPNRVESAFFLGAPERLADDVVDGASCYRIRGTGRETPYRLITGSTSAIVEDERLTVWIDRNSLLLRRVEERRTLSTYSTVTVTSYVPEIDVEIPDRELAFDPPPQP